MITDLLKTQYTMNKLCEINNSEIVLVSSQPLLTCSPDGKIFINFCRDLSRIKESFNVCDFFEYLEKQKYIVESDEPVESIANILFYLSKCNVLSIVKNEVACPR